MVTGLVSARLEARAIISEPDIRTDMSKIRSSQQDRERRRGVMALEASSVSSN